MNTHFVSLARVDLIAQELLVDIRMLKQARTDLTIVRADILADPENEWLRQRLWCLCDDASTAANNINRTLRRLASLEVHSEASAEVRDAERRIFSAT